MRIGEKERVGDVAVRAARIAGTPGTIHPIQVGGRILNPLQTFAAQLHYTPSIIWQYGRLRGGVGQVTKVPGAARRIRREGTRHPHSRERGVRGIPNRRSLKTKPCPPRGAKNQD